MPRYPSYRFASEFQRHGRPVDPTLEISFLRVFREDDTLHQDGLLRAGLHPHPQATENDHWSEGTTLTDAADAMAAAARHPGNESLQQEQLLIAAYHRLDHDKDTPRNVYVPAELRPWAARFTLDNQEILLYVQAATESGARYAAIEECRLLIESQEDAKFTRME